MVSLLNNIILILHSGSKGEMSRGDRFRNGLVMPESSCRRVMWRMMPDGRMSIETYRVDDGMYVREKIIHVH